MSTPDYIITRTVLDEQMQRQFRDTPNADLSEPWHRPTGPGRFTTARRQPSAALHTVANRIDPQPANPAPGTATGPAR